MTINESGHTLLVVKHICHGNLHELAPRFQNLLKNLASIHFNEQTHPEQVLFLMVFIIYHKHTITLNNWTICKLKKKIMCSALEQERILRDTHSRNPYSVGYRRNSSGIHPSSKEVRRFASQPRPWKPGMRRTGPWIIESRIQEKKSALTDI